MCDFIYTVWGKGSRAWESDLPVNSQRLLSNLPERSRSYTNRHRHSQGVHVHAPGREVNFLGINLEG